MKHSILNQEFRDQTSSSRYPFQDSATMINDIGTKVPDSIFLDMLVSSMLDRDLPFYVSSIDASFGEERQARMTIKDSKGREVCHCLLDPGTDLAPKDTCQMYDSYDRLAGTVVYNPDELLSLIRGMRGTLQTFSSRQLPLLAERCFVFRLPGLSTISGGGSSWAGRALIVAARGVHFTDDGGKVQVHLLGEESTTNRPVKSINGIERSHIWMAANPDSAVKVETRSGDIKIWKITDDN